MPAFKIDENLPSEAAAVLQQAGHDAKSVIDQGMQGASDARVAQVCRQEERALMTLDVGFGDISAYPPEDYAGIVVLRLRSQQAAHVRSVLRRLLSEMEHRELQGTLWIVDEQRIRIR
ncbi:MAG: DUF5615 family PIN-like protein [Phycisphaerae bacterium]|nr:DUF5615 family PIN-like protein [Phycisphaerae bacterium]